MTRRSLWVVRFHFAQGAMWLARAVGRKSRMEDEYRRAVEQWKSAPPRAGAELQLVDQKGRVVRELSVGSDGTTLFEA